MKKHLLPDCQKSYYSTLLSVRTKRRRKKNSVFSCFFFLSSFVFLFLSFHINKEWFSSSNTKTKLLSRLARLIFFFFSSSFFASPHCCRHHYCPDKCLILYPRKEREKKRACLTQRIQWKLIIWWWRKKKLNERDADERVQRWTLPLFSFAKSSKLKLS